MFRAANLAVDTWLKSLSLNNKSFNVVYASPERAVSSLASVLGTTDKLVPLPIISFFRSREPILDTSFFTYNKGIKDIKPSGDGKFVSILPRPLGYNIGFNVEIWSWYIDEIDCIQDVIISSFNRDLYLNQISRVGTILLRLELSDINDNSDLESGTNPRLLRKTITLGSTTFLIRPPSLVRSVLDINVAILDLDTQVVLDQPIIVIGNVMMLPIETLSSIISTTTMVKESLMAPASSFGSGLFGSGPFGTKNVSFDITVESR